MLLSAQRKTSYWKTGRGETSKGKGSEEEEVLVKEVGVKKKEYRASRVSIKGVLWSALIKEEEFTGRLLR